MQSAYSHLRVAVFIDVNQLNAPQKNHILSNIMGIIPFLMNTWQCKAKPCTAMYSLYSDCSFSGKGLVGFIAIANAYVDFGAEIVCAVLP